jgi:hypothetical protein
MIGSVGSAGRLAKPLSAAAVAAFAVFVAAPQAHADAASQATETPAEESTLLQGLDVTAPDRAQSVHKKVEAYVSGVTVRTENWSLARWHRPICPLVAGLPKSQGEAVLARVSEVLLKAGAPLDKGKCQPNLTIIVTAEPERLLRKWRERNSRLFAQGLAAQAKRFLETDRPARVWYNVAQLSADTMPAQSSSDPDMLGATNFAGLKTNNRARHSRLEWNGLRSIDSAIVVIDATRATHLTPGQLADYAAMVGLTELDLGSKVGPAPTILRLFDTAPAESPDGLSAWDQAFLEALYSTESRSKLQAPYIADRVFRSVQRPPEGEGPG